MNDRLSPRYEEYIQQAIDRGEFASREELLIHAVGLLRERLERRKQSQVAIDQANHSEHVTPAEKQMRLEEEVARRINEMKHNKDRAEANAGIEEVERGDWVDGDEMFDRLEQLAQQLIDQPEKAQAYK